MKFASSIYLFIALIAAAACKKDSYITDRGAIISTSTDSLYFDTVFTSVGSITRFVKIFNENDQKLVLSSVRLGNLNSSYFKMNVDGIASPEVSNIEIEANDSIYVFVTVKIDPLNVDLPVIIRDSIEVIFNGNSHKIQLSAWGQDANFLRSATISANETWSNSKPYVILDGININENTTLLIEQGARIYLHANAPFIVNGTLHVKGEKFDSTKVVFQGDRLDDPYRNFPGSWPGIFFTASSRNNQLNYAEIRNAYQGIVIEAASGNSNVKLEMNQCLIDNSFDAGIIAINSSIEASNCLFSNNGKGIILAAGGDYRFNHCTIAAFSNEFMIHKEPSVLINNFMSAGTSIQTFPLNANFTNTIIWGDNGTVDNEFVIFREGTTAFNVSLDHSLYKNKEEISNIQSTNSIINQDPQFDSINTQARFFDFRLDPNSPAVEKGKSSTITIDLDGKPRPVNLPDIGSYERR